MFDIDPLQSNQREIRNEWGIYDSVFCAHSN